LRRHDSSSRPRREEEAILGIQGKQIHLSIYTGVERGRYKLDANAMARYSSDSDKQKGVQVYCTGGLKHPV